MYWYDDADTTTKIGRVVTSQTTGINITAADVKTFDLAAGASAISIFPTGFAAGADIEIIIKADYDSTEPTATRILEVVPDGAAAAIQMREWYASICDATLTIAASTTTKTTKIKVYCVEHT